MFIFIEIKKFYFCGLFKLLIKIWNKKYNNLPDFKSPHRIKNRQKFAVEIDIKSKIILDLQTNSEFFQRVKCDFVYRSEIMLNLLPKFDFEFGVNIGRIAVYENILILKWLYNLSFQL